MAHRTRARCPHCAKTVTVTVAGVLRHHRSTRTEFPGSPWTLLCPGAGLPAPKEDTP